jgi:hypothetical protein
MSEYQEFRDWSRRHAEELDAAGRREELIGFLQSLHLLASDLLAVCDAMAMIRGGSLLSILSRLKQYRKLWSDPLRTTRQRMRTIRAGTAR